KGYLCFESEGGPVEFKHMRITELPGDAALKPDQVSLILPEGVRTTCLFGGLNLDGWTPGEGQKAQWTVEDRFLQCAGKSKGGLSHALPPADFTLQLDWRKDKNDKEEAAPFVI